MPTTVQQELVSRTQIVNRKYGLEIKIEPFEDDENYNGVADNHDKKWEKPCHNEHKHEVQELLQSHRNSV